MNPNSSVAYNYDWLDDEYSDAQRVPSDIKKPLTHAGLREPTVEADKEKSVLILAVKELSNTEYKITLREPIPVYLEGEHRQYIAFHEASRISGQGENVPTAFRDFEDTFISVFLSYTRSGDPLSSGANKYTKFLSQLIENIEKIQNG